MLSEIRNFNWILKTFFLLMIFHSESIFSVGTPSPHRCQSAISALATDLKGLKLTKKKTEQIFTILFDARRLCALGHQKPALKDINKARALAGLKETTGDYDWENVPLESLEGNND